MNYSIYEQLINSSTGTMKIDEQEIKELNKNDGCTIGGWQILEDVNGLPSGGYCDAIMLPHRIYSFYKSAKEKGELKMNVNIVDMWIEKTYDKYDELRTDAQQKIESKDPFVKSISEIEKEIRQLMDVYNIDIEDQRLCIYVLGRDYRQMITPESRKLINKLNEKFEEVYTKTIDIAKEVKTIIADCNDYNESIRVLKAYDIVDEHGRLKVAVDESYFSEFVQ